MKNNLYFIFFDSVFSWKHKPWMILKPIIKWRTKSNFNHCGISYDYADQKQYIKEHLGGGFVSTHYQKAKRDRYCKCIAYEACYEIDFKKLHRDVQDYMGKPYGYFEMAKPLLYKIKWLSNLYSKITGSNEEDNDSVCSATAMLLAVKNQGYLQHIDSSSVSPERLRKILLKNKLVHPTPIVVWNKKLYIKNIFKDLRKKNKTQGI